jgi:exonuclease VII small subunit
MTGKVFGRRQVLAASATAALTSLAGCSGNEKAKEMNAAGEDAGDHLDSAESTVQTAFEHNDNEEFQSCVDELDGVDSEIQAAREDAQTGLELATELESEDEIRVFELMIQFSDQLEVVATDLEGVCTAARDENWDVYEQKVDALETNVSKLESTTSELDQALTETG